MRPLLPIDQRLFRFPFESGLFFAVKPFHVDEQNHVLREIQRAEADPALGRFQLEARFGVPEVQPGRAGEDLPLRFQEEPPDRDAEIAEAVVGDVGAPDGKRDLVVGALIDHRPHQAVAQKRGLFVMIGQNLPDDVLPGQEFRPVHAVGLDRFILGRLEKRAFFNHPPDLLKRLDVNLTQAAVVVGADVERENVAVFDRAEVVAVDLLRVGAKAVVFGERVEPLRPALVFGEDRVRKLGGEVLVVRRGVPIVAGPRSIVQSGRLAALADADLAGALAVIVADERVRLDLVTKRGRFFVRKPAGPGRVVKPDVLDRAVLGEEFAQLRLFRFGIDRLVVPVHAAGPVPIPFGEVERELDAVLVAGFPQFGQNVLFQGGVGRFELGRFCVPEAEPVVMFREEEDVAHAGFFGRPRPVVRIDLGCAEE